MRRLLILTGREIRDQLGFFVAAAAILVIATFVMVSLVLTDHKEVVPLLSAAVVLPGAGLLAILLCGFGESQMQADRTKNLSAFLAALPVTRRQIFLARILTGLLWILTFLIPLTAVAAFLIEYRRPPLIPLYGGLLTDAFAGVFLTCLACYCVGLYAGCATNTSVLWLREMPLVICLPLLVIIKGFGVELVVILSLFIVACLTGAWCRFSRSSL
jgi:hypothetical protein